MQGILRTTHGLSGTPVYNLWTNMRRRCRAEPVYVRSGISVCDEWRDVSVFAEWAMSNGFAPGLDLDRRDTLGNYSPENCRFISRKENTQNVRDGFFWHIKGGVYHSARDAAKALGVGYSTIQCWVNGQRGAPGRPDCWRVAKYPQAT